MRPTIIFNHLPLLPTIGGALLLMRGVACTPPEPAALPPGTPEPDRYLFEHGSTLFEEEDWDKATTVFRRLVDVYPQSPYRFDAKLAIGDSLLSKGGLSSLIQAVNEFEEFLRFYPTHPRAAYAQSRMRNAVTPRAAQAAGKTILGIVPGGAVSSIARKSPSLHGIS